MTRKKENPQPNIGIVFGKLKKMEKQGRKVIKGDKLNARWSRISLEKVPAVLGNGVTIKPSTFSALFDAGLGLFAERIFCKGEKITEYCGTAIWKDTCPKDYPRSHVINRRDCWLIDCKWSATEALQLGVGGAAFANDAKSTALFSIFFNKSVGSSTRAALNSLFLYLNILSMGKKWGHLFCP